MAPVTRILSKLIYVFITKGKHRGIESSFKVSKWAVSGCYSQSAASPHPGLRHRRTPPGPSQSPPHGRGRRRGAVRKLEMECSVIRAAFPPVQAPSRSRHISETAQTAHSPTSLLVPEAQARVRRAIGNTCSAACAARSRRDAQPALGGFRVCPAGS